MRRLLLTTAATLAGAMAMAQNTGIGTPAPTDQLHTTGTVRFEGYRGNGLRLMQMDSSGRVIVTGAGTVFTASPYAAIPDNGCSTGNGLSSPITVSGMGTAVPSSRIAVRINITHPSTSDLRLMLVAPGGASLLLMGGTISGGANFINTIFTDASQVTMGGTAAVPPYTGKYKPIGSTTSLCLNSNTLTSFSAIGGGSIVPNGTWTLKVYDGISGNTGTLNSWDISFSGPESFATAEQNNYLPKFSAGNLEASSIYQDGSGNIGIRTTSPASTLHIADQSDDVLTLSSTAGLTAGTNTFLDFKSSNYYTGRIGTEGTGTQTASLAFYTSAGGSASALFKRMSILDNGNVGIGLTDANVSEKLHVDGNMKLGLAVWSAAANDRLLKFGDGSYVSIGEAGADDRMQLTAGAFIFKRLTGVTQVGINTASAPAYTLDVTGDLRTTAGATIQGPAQVGGVLSTSSNLQVSGTARIVGGSPAAGKVLTATNTSGDATWQALPAPPSQNTGFKAFLQYGGPYNSGTSSILDSMVEMFDHGANFDPLTGIYTAPATGTYSFSFNGHFGGQYVQYVEVSVQVGGTAVETHQGPATQSQVGPSYTDGQLSFTTLLPLTAGQQVRLSVSAFCQNYSGSGGGNGYYYLADGINAVTNAPSFFSGYRVY